MIAAATGFTVVRMKGGETGPAYGAARLARLAATGSARGALQAARDRRRDRARSGLAEAFARQGGRFKALYSAVKGEFQRGA